MGTFTDARLVQACERILQDEPNFKKENHECIGSLMLKDLVLKLQQRFAIPVRAAALRKVLEHNQDAIVQVDEFEFLHVSKLDEQSVSGGSGEAKGAGEVEGHDIPDVLAPLDEKQHLASTFRDYSLEASDRAGDRPSKPGPLLSLASQPVATVSPPSSASPEVNDKTLPAGEVEITGKRTRDSVEESKEEREESMSVDMPMAQDFQRNAARMSGILNHLGKPPSGQTVRAKQEQSATCLAPPIDTNAQKHLPKAAEHQALKTGPVKREPGSCASQEAQAGDPVRDSASQHDGSQAIRYQLEGLKQCQDQIKTLLAQRQSIEEQIASKLATFAKSPNHEAEACQLRAYLGQLSGNWLGALIKAQQAREVTGREEALLISQHAAQADSKAAVCDEKPAIGAGRQKRETVDLYDSDTEILVDAEAAKEQWAKAQKRKRKKEAATSDGESLAKRVKVVQEAEQENGKPASAQQEKEQEKASGLGGHQENPVGAAAEAPTSKIEEEIQVRVKPAPSQSDAGNADRAAFERGAEAAALLLGASRLGVQTTSFPDTVSTPRQLAQEPLAHRASEEEKVVGPTAREGPRMAEGVSIAQAKKSAEPCQKSGDLGQRVRADAQTSGKAETLNVFPPIGSLLYRPSSSEIKGESSKVQHFAPTESGGPPSNANGLEREAASASKAAENEACEAKGTNMPASAQAENSKQRLGLQFLRKYYGDKPKRKRPRRESSPIDWEIGGHDEEGRKLLHALFGGDAALPFEARPGWTLELKSPEGLEGCIDSFLKDDAPPNRDAQLRESQQRKQSVPRSLAEIKRGKQ